MAFQTRNELYPPIHENFMKRVYPRNTICQLLRDTYWLTEDSEIRLNLRIAVNMAKAMNRKLREYAGADWDKSGFWAKNDNYDDIVKKPGV